MALLALACVLGLAAQALEQAQQDQPHAGAVQNAETGKGLEEIVVSARRRKDNLQHTALAISAFTDNALAERKISYLPGIPAVATNLRFDAAAPISGSSNSAQLFIRGMSQWALI